MKHISTLTLAALISMASLSKAAEPGDTTAEAKVKKTERVNDNGKVEKSTEAKVKTESGDERAGGKVEHSSEAKVKKTEGASDGAGNKVEHSSETKVKTESGSEKPKAKVEHTTEEKVKTEGEVKKTTEEKVEIRR